MKILVLHCLFGVEGGTKSGRRGLGVEGGDLEWKAGTKSGRRGLGVEGGDFL